MSLVVKWVNVDSCLKNRRNWFEMKRSDGTSQTDFKDIFIHRSDSNLSELWQQSFSFSVRKYSRIRDLIFINKNLQNISTSPLTRSTLSTSIALIDACSDWIYFKSTHSTTSLLPSSNFPYNECMAIINWNQPRIHQYVNSLAKETSAYYYIAFIPKHDFLLSFTNIKPDITVAISRSRQQPYPYKAKASDALSCGEAAKRWNWYQ